jgi:methylmalonyl-CoA mutase, N-terminal domain
VAAATGAKPGCFSGSGMREEAYMRCLGRWRRADWAAIDTSRRYSRKEVPVESRIAATDGSVAELEVVVKCCCTHVLIIQGMVEGALAVFGHRHALLWPGTFIISEVRFFDFLMHTMLFENMTVQRENMGAEMAEEQHDEVPVVSETKRQWMDETFVPSLKRTPERDDPFTTSSGMSIDPLYGTEERDPMIGFPGEYPYTRGVQPAAYRSRLWTMRQYAGYATAEESNRRYRYLLDSGTTGLSVAFDLPTQMGYDPDNELAEGEVGKVGVSIASLPDMERLFDGIPLEKISTSMTINATASILLAFYIAAARKQGIEPRQLSGTIQNDILKEYIARGTYIYPPRPSMRIITDIFRYCADEVPRWNTISISGYHIREAGSTAAQEVGFTLANGIAYVQAALDAGLEVDTFAPQLSFFFNGHSNFFEEVGKFRAARRMWAAIMRARFGARDPRSLMLRFHTQTAGSTLTAQQPDNNIVRTAYQAMAAVLGGTQSLHTNAKDEALALPTPETALLALRTQQVLAYETGVTDTIDPLAGSYYVEALTNDIEQRAWEYIRKVDELGGSVRAIELGYIQREIEEAAYRYQREIEEQRRIIVGVNRFVQEEVVHPSVLRIDPEQERLAKQRISELRATRDNTAVGAALRYLEETARGGGNLMPCIVSAGEALATLGEIADTLRRAFGEQGAIGQ